MYMYLFQNLTICTLNRFGNREDGDVCPKIRSNPYLETISGLSKASNGFKLTYKDMTTTFGHICYCSLCMCTY